MATFVGTSFGAGNSATLTWTEPASCAEGDVVYLFGFQHGASRTLTPTGTTTINFVNKNEQTGHGSWFAWAVRGSGAFNLGWTSTTDDGYFILASVWRGVDTTTPFDDWDVNYEGGPTYDFLAVTTGGPDSAVVGALCASGHMETTGNTWDNDRYGAGNDMWLYDEVVASAGSSGTNTASFAESVNSFMWTVAVNDAGPTPETTQLGFRWRNDDGSQTTATWMASQDTNGVFAELASSNRVRFLLDAVADPASFAPTLRYKKSTDGTYVVVPVGATVTAPTWVANGAQTINAAAITPALPGSLAVDDYLVCFVETANQTTSIANGNGATWTQIGTQVGTGTGGSTSATRISLWGTFYDGVITTGPTTNDSGDHQLGFIAAFRGVDPASPINVTATYTTEAGPSTVNIPGAVTTRNNCTVVAVVADDWDNASTTRYTTWTNSNLTSLTERFDSGSTTQNGGGIGMAVGVMATAGNYGTTTAAANASILANANASFALNPILRPVYIAPSANITAGGEDTTQQLVDAGSKTFTTGRMWDDENGTDPIDLNDSVTEVEWSVGYQSPAVDGDIYQLRVYAGSSALDGYDVTPEIEIGSGGEQELIIDPAVLTLTGQQPSITTDTTALTIATATLTLTGQQPVLVGDGAVDLTITPAALTLTAQQPAVSPVAADLIIDPAALTLTSQQPVVEGTGDTSLTIDTANLVLTGQQPNLAGDTFELTIATATLTLTAQEVNLEAGAQQLIVDTAVLTLTAQQPVVAADTVELTVTPAALTLTGQQPTLTADGSTAEITVDTAALTLTASEVVVSAGAQQLTIDTAILTLTGQQPTITTDTVALTIDTAALTLSAVQPVLTGDGDSTALTITPAALTLTAQEVNLSAGAQVLTIDPAQLTLTAQQPLVAGDTVALTVDTAILSLTAQEVTLLSNAQILSIDTAILALTAQQPVLSGDGGAVTLTITPAALTLTGQQPSLEPEPTTLVIASAVLTLTGQQPALTPDTAELVIDPAALVITPTQPEIIGIGTSEIIITPAILVLMGVEVFMFAGIFVPPADRVADVASDPRVARVAPDVRVVVALPCNRTAVVR